MVAHAKPHRAEQAGTPQDTWKDWIRWLSLVPAVLLFMVLCGQLALFASQAPRADTRSLMQADYKPWPYIQFNPVDPAIIQEILQDQEGGISGTLQVETDSFWLIQTQTEGEAPLTPTRTQFPAGAQEATATSSPSPTLHTVLPSLTPTSSKTLTSTPAATSTYTQAPSPTHTQTTVYVPSATPRPPRPAKTATPTVTLTATQLNTPTLPPIWTDTPTALPTPSATPTPTDTPVPTSTDTLIPPTLTHTPTATDPSPRLSISPILEGPPVRNPDGSCTASWGYQNPNPFPVVIPVNSTPGSPHNRFSPPPPSRGQPETFLPGRQVNVFTVTWGSGGSGGNLIWILDGNNATADWCW